MTCLTIRAPDYYPELVAGVTGVTFIKRAAPAEFIHVFCRRRREVSPLFQRALKSIKGGGMIWVSWPKKTSSLYRDLTEQDFRDVILPQAWVDVKVCAIDTDWSGLKFVKRKA